MTGTRGKRVKLSPTTHSPSIPIDPSLTGHTLDPASPSFDSPNASPQPQASGSNGGGGTVQSSGGTDRAAERKERNRLAAQRSRDKRAAEFQAVAEQLSHLRVENEELKIKLEEKDEELRQKDERISELESLVATGGHENGNGNGNSTTTTTALGGGLSDLVHASNFLDQSPPNSPQHSHSSYRMKNIVVVGGSYVGLMATQEVIKLLPQGSDCRVVVVEKNSHFSHLFAYPRFAIVPSHEQKAFLPFETMLPSPHQILSSTTALSVSPDTRTITLLDSTTGKQSDLEYEVLVLATGTQLSPPGTIPGTGTKREGIEYLQSLQADLERSKRVCILGGGAIGVQMACDLATLYPPSRTGKSITLLHSHETLMNRFHPTLSDIIKERFNNLGVKTVLGSRAKIPSGGFTETNGKKITIETEDGRKLEADCIIQSTGQTANSSLVSTFAPSAIASNGFVTVDSSLLLIPEDESEKIKVDGRIFAIGDIANTGAQKAARPAMQHSQVLARNILKLLSTDPSSFESISIAPSAIHLTLGFTESIIFRNPANQNSESGEWEGEPQIVWKDDGREDMGIEDVWDRRLGKRPRGERDYHL
ncbi:hypothetical protein JCM3765_006187 [Sporobolomyces pararoseus]